MRLPVRRRWPAILISLAALSWSVSPNPAVAASAKAAVERGAPVVVAKVERRDVPRLVHTVGSVLASSTVQVKSLVEGRILEAFFTEGQMMKAGDLLFRIDPRPFQADLDQATAVLARDQAQLDSARLEFARQRDLSARGVASAQKFEQAQASEKALAATVASDAAAVNNARLKLGYTEIRSPIPGKTGPILIHPGNIVKANGDTAMVVVSTIEPVRVSVTLPQKQLPMLQARMREGGTDLRVTVPGDPQPPVVGRVDFIASTVDSLSGTIEVRASVGNADHRLVPGQFVTADMVLENLKNVLVVPYDAITPGQMGTYVYRVGDDGKAELKVVKVLYSDGDIAAVEGDLARGDKVVTDGQLRLAPGVAVKIAPAADKPKAE